MLAPFFISLLLVGTLTSLAIALYGLQQRRQPGMLLLTLLGVVIALWQLIGIAELQAATFSEKYRWDTAEFILMSLLAPLFFATALHLTQRSSSVPTPLLALIYLTPVVDILLFARSSPPTDPFRLNLHLDQTGWLPGLNYDFGPAAYFFGAYSLALTVVTFGIAAHHVRQLPPYRRFNVRVIGVSLAIPWLLSLLVYFRHPSVLPRGVHPLPVVLTVTSIVIAAEFLRNRPRDLVPAVREAVMEGMREGVLVADLRERIIDHNPASQRLLHLPPATLIGKRLSAILPELEPLRSETGELPNDSPFQMQRTIEGVVYHYSGNINHLRSQGGNRLGTVVSFQDVTLAWQAQQALKCAHKEAERRARELEAIQQTMHEISSDMGLEPLLTAILERAISLVNGNDGEIALYEPRSGEVEVVVSIGMDKDYRGVRLRLGEGIMGRVAATKESMVVPEYLSWAGRSGLYHSETKSHTVIAVPLFAGDSFLGIIDVGFHEPRQLQSSDISMMTLFAQQAAVALYNARLYAEASRRADEAELLRRAGVLVSSTLEQQESTNRILKQLEDIVPFDRAELHLLSGGFSQIVGERGHGGADGTLGRRLPLDGDSPFRFVYGLRRPQLLADIAERYPLFRALPYHGLHGWLAVPLLEGGQATGLLSLYAHDHSQFTANEARQVSAFATQVAAALQNVRQFAEMQQQAVTDVLTGLYNRRYFFELAAELEAEAIASGTPLSVVMLDLDRFKQVNDSYGHLTGDRVLKVIAHRCNDLLREGDLFARYGGEEFILLLPDTTLHDALAVAERLRVAVAGAPVPARQGDIPITISLGVAELKLDAQERIEEVIRRADQALYRAKESGRNKAIALPYVQQEESARVSPHHGSF